jgi:hypothetical protein
MNKTFFFWLITFLTYCCIYNNSINHDTVWNIIIVVSYIIFVLITLYDIGKRVEEQEEKDKKDQV